MVSRVLLAVVVLAGAPLAASAQTPSPPDAIDLFVAGLEQAAAAGDRAAIMATGDPGTSVEGLEDFAETFVPTATRVVIKERDRAPLPDGLQRLLLEVFVERGIESRVATWRIDLRGPGTPEGAGGWRIARVERLTVVTGLYRLSLDATRQFDVRNLTLTGQDLALHLPSGTAFLAENPDGPTAVVLMGRGMMRFTPPDEAERTQISIFAGDESLNAEFDAAFIRVRPSEFETRFKAESLVAREVSPSDLRKADEIFEDYIGKTLQIDLTDLSRERWSLVPTADDLIAEVRTRKYGSLTYARSASDAEDVTVFDRKKRRNIALYASEAKLASRGRFYSEDDLVDFDVMGYEIDATFTPDRGWVSGNARLKLKVRAPSVTTMALRLAESLSVRGVYSSLHGRLLHLRVVGQNSLLVNLPAPATRDTELWLTVLYSGRIEPQELDREAIALGQEQEPLVIPLEPRFVFSNRSYWYPQSTVTDYATAKLRLTVPPDFEAIGTGSPVGPPAPAPGAVEPGQQPNRTFIFQSDRPVRYLSCVISRFETITTAELNVPSPGPRAEPRLSAGPAQGADGGPDDSVALVVQANPRQSGRARALAERSGSIFQFYASIVGEAPYPSFTLAVIESDLPGGHSPAYFALLNQPLPSSMLVWRNDPVAFDNYPTFFLAHELAHQWWGQAVGWKNYHEQWLSEGFAQYFAVLYAGKERGDGLMTNLTRQMRKTAIDASPQGPVYLGYRLGHIRSDSRVFRALVYNKGAMVLHMLRRLVGDDRFFQGVRQFYTDWRFKKAGTDDFRAAMEAASGQDLSSFFEAWIYSAGIPELRFSSKIVGASELQLRFEHRRNVAPVPVTVTIVYANEESESIVVPVTERVVERTVPLRGAVREVRVNDDNAALAEVVR